MWFLLFLIFINDWFLRCRRSPLLPIFQRDLLWKQLLRIQVNTDLLLPVLRIHLIFSSPFSLFPSHSLFSFPLPFPLFPFIFIFFPKPNESSKWNIYTPVSNKKLYRLYEFCFQFKSYEPLVHMYFLFRRLCTQRMVGLFIVRPDLMDKTMEVKTLYIEYTAHYTLHITIHIAVYTVHCVLTLNTNY